MSGAEFVDTNIFIYAHDSSAGSKHEDSAELLTRLWEERAGAISIQVLSEFYNVSCRKLNMSPTTAAAIVEELGLWTVHTPRHPDLLAAIALQRRYHLSWWDALILQSAQAMHCRILWSEDFADGQRYGSLTVRNPFRRAKPKTRRQPR